MSEINVYSRHKIFNPFLDLYPPQPINRFLRIGIRNKKFTLKKKLMLMASR